MQQPPEQLTVEDLVAMVQRLPAGVSAIPTVAQGLHSLDSRACAALLKDLSKNGLPHHALSIFDWLQSLPTDNQLTRLCDVFTYTTGTACVFRCMVVLYSGPGSSSSSNSIDIMQYQWYAAAACKQQQVQ